jgi:RNA polymerase sigma-70 factor, ECF subfamily
MKHQNKSDEFLKVYDQFADDIFRHCYFRTSDRELARDLMQETFLRAWKRMADNQEIKHMRGFLYRIAHNLLVDQYRKKKFAPVSLDTLQEQGFTPASKEQEKINQFIDVQDVIAFLDKIDSKYRDVIIMRYVDELSPKEIAEILGETENTISVRIHRALKQIRITLKDHEKLT